MYQWQCTMMAPLYTCGMSSPRGRAGPASSLSLVPAADCDRGWLWQYCERTPGHGRGRAIETHRHCVTTVSQCLFGCYSTDLRASSQLTECLSVKIQMIPWPRFATVSVTTVYSQLPHTIDLTWFHQVEGRDDILFCQIVSGTREGPVEGWGEG